MLLKRNKIITISLLTFLQSISLSSPNGKRKLTIDFTQGDSVYTQGDDNGLRSNEKNLNLYSSALHQDKDLTFFQSYVPEKEDVQPLHWFGRYILDILPSFRYHDLKIMAEKKTPYCLFDDHLDFSSQPFDDFETKGYCLEREIKKKLQTLRLTCIGDMLDEHKKEAITKLIKKMITLHGKLLSQEGLREVLEDDSEGLEAVIGAKLTTIFLSNEPLLGNSSELFLTSIYFEGENKQIIACTEDSQLFNEAFPIFSRDLFDFYKIFAERRHPVGANFFHNIFFRKKFNYSQGLEICTSEGDIEYTTDFWKDDFFVIKDDFLERMHNQGILFKPFVMNHIFFKLLGSLWGNKELEECFSYVQTTKNINGPEAQRLRNIFQCVLSPKERQFLTHNLFTLNKKYTLHIKKDFYRNMEKDLESYLFFKNDLRIKKQDDVDTRIIKNKFHTLQYKSICLKKDDIKNIKNYIGYETFYHFNIEKFTLQTIKGFFNHHLLPENNLYISYLSKFCYYNKFFFNVPHNNPQLIKLVNFEVIHKDFFPLESEILYSKLFSFFVIDDTHKECSEDSCEQYGNCLHPGKDNDQSFLFPVTMTSNYGFHQHYNYNTIKKIMSSYKKTKKHFYVHQEDKITQEENELKSIKFKEFSKLFCEKFFQELEEIEQITYFDFFATFLYPELHLTQENYPLLQGSWDFINDVENAEVTDEMNFKKQFAVLQTIKKFYTSCILKDYEEEYKNLEAEVLALKQLLNFHRSLFMYNKKKNLDFNATKAFKKEEDDSIGGAKDDPMDGTSKTKVEVKNFLPDYCRREIYLTIWHFLINDKIRNLIYYYVKVYDPIYKNEYENIVKKNLLWNLMSSYHHYQSYNDQEFYNNIRFIYKKFVVPLIIEILYFEKEKYYNTDPSMEDKKEKERFYNNLLPTLEDLSSDSEEEDFFLENSLIRKTLEEKFSYFVKNKKKDYFYKKGAYPRIQNQENFKVEENQIFMNFFHKDYKEEKKENENENKFLGKEKDDFSKEEMRILEKFSFDSLLVERKSLLEHGISKGNLKKK